MTGLGELLCIQFRIIFGNFNCIWFRKASYKGKQNPNEVLKIDALNSDFDFAVKKIMHPRKFAFPAGCKDNQIDQIDQKGKLMHLPFLQDFQIKNKKRSRSSFLISHFPHMKYFSRWNEWKYFIFKKWWSAVRKGHFLSFKTWGICCFYLC